MITTPIEQLASLRVGTVEFISPDRIEVQLDIESPDSVALNTGMPRSFPRINGYLMIPVDLGFVVGQVSWITIQRSPYPKRSGFQDFGLIDLPFPLRKMELQPVGTLVATEDGYKFKRGLETFPSVGDIVILPMEDQLRSIIESGDNRRVYIGNSPLVGNAKVMIDPDRLFGRHLAVLGNTGSGKSCSVAGLIRWSLESAREKLVDSAKTVNSRFIVLDPNGEYSKAFVDKQEANIYMVNVENGGGKKQLEVPLWFWNTDEWCGFTKASPKTHRTTIVHALKSVKSGIVFEELSKQRELASYVRTIIDTIEVNKAAGNPWGKFPFPKNFHQSVEKWVSGIVSDEDYSGELKDAIQAFEAKANELINARSGTYPHYDYTRAEVDSLITLLKEVYAKAGGKEEEFLPTDEDSPIPFTGENFIRSIEANAEILNTTDYIVTLMPRIKTLLTDVRVKKVIDNETLKLSEWLGNYIGADNKESLTIIDLSLLPSDVTSIVTAVIARMVFEAQQRYLRLNKQCLPTVLVMEEAHYFVKRYNDDAENTGPTTQCCKVFEKIAREGRKFGLGLVLSSQRPSELSSTVLSQCNSFLLHRISNDRDQELVHRLLPDNMRGILREMPSLPSQYAVLLGWASELPIMVKMRTLPKNQCPQSDDPDYWDVWTGLKECKIDWGMIADDWQNKKDDMPTE
ncbi:MULTISPECIES: ATP-binding protein [Bacteroides]|jgi:DNA helicase HerA-like ATPase|uniref:ATP-binding protein n=1 Tax=Bacteroides TaxID=816 RepID=UPI00202E110C|nr:MULTISPECIES: ATP-binding protein [Bacteroides]MCM0337389.1 ATP-binding protein [Bacteroides fragilis]MDA3619703.1 ATP-binding protein [Bacteroides sp. 47]